MFTLARPLSWCCLAVLLLAVSVVAAAAPKGDGFPSGRATPEGAACDLARAFIKRDVALFKATCLPPFGGGESRKQYEAFFAQTVKSIAAEAKRSTPSPGGPKSIGKVFAARHLSKNGPASYGYAMFDFKDVQFVDVGVFLHDGAHALNRTLVVQAPSGKWYVHPIPTVDPFLSSGLNEESPSTRDYAEAAPAKKR